VVIPSGTRAERNSIGNPGFQPWRAPCFRIHSAALAHEGTLLGEIQHRITEICALQSRHW